MFEIVRSLIANQFEAALCTLNVCIERCPDRLWNAPVANYAFCQVAFHTVFYSDYYLGPNESTFRDQPFHRDNPAFFRDYEEFEDRAPVLLYDKPMVRRYVEHCRQKLSTALAAETDATLSARCGFERRAMSRAELYVYNMRHIQHHAAQLSLRLRLDAREDVPWIASGWRKS